MSEEEYGLVMRVKDAKAAYKEAYGELAAVKDELAYTESLIKQCGRELVAEFKDWYLREFGTQGEIEEEEEYGGGGRAAHGGARRHSTASTGAVSTSTAAAGGGGGGYGDDDAEDSSPNAKAYYKLQETLVHPPLDAFGHRPGSQKKSGIARRTAGGFGASPRLDITEQKHYKSSIDVIPHKAHATYYDYK